MHSEGYGYQLGNVLFCLASPFFQHFRMNWYLKLAISIRE